MRVAALRSTPSHPCRKNANQRRRCRSSRPCQRTIPYAGTVHGKVSGAPSKATTRMLRALVDRLRQPAQAVWPPMNWQPVRGKLRLPLGFLLWYHGLWQRQVWYQRKNGGRRLLARALKLASDGTPPSLQLLMPGSHHHRTKRSPERTPYVGL